MESSTTESNRVRVRQSCRRECKGMESLMLTLLLRKPRKTHMSCLGPIAPGQAIFLPTVFITKYSTSGKLFL